MDVVGALRSNPDVLIGLQRDAGDNVVGPWEDTEGTRRRGLMRRRGPMGSIHAEVWETDLGWAVNLWGSEGVDDNGGPIRYQTREEAMTSVDESLVNAERILADGDPEDDVDDSGGLMDVETRYEKILDAFLKRPALLVAVLRETPQVLGPWKRGRDRGGPWNYDRCDGSGNVVISVNWESRDWGPERWFLYRKGYDGPVDLKVQGGHSGEEAKRKADGILVGEGVLLL